MVGLIQDFAALHMQRKLEGNLSLTTGELSWLQHVYGAAEDLDGLSTQVSRRVSTHSHASSTGGADAPVFLDRQQAASVF